MIHPDKKKLLLNAGLSEKLVASLDDRPEVQTAVCRFPGCTRYQSSATYFCVDHTPIWVKSTHRRRAFQAEGDYEVAVQEFIAEHGPVAQLAERPGDTPAE